MARVVAEYILIDRMSQRLDRIRDRAKRFEAQQKRLALAQGQVERSSGRLGAAIDRLSYRYKKWGDRLAGVRREQDRLTVSQKKYNAVFAQTARAMRAVPAARVGFGRWSARDNAIVERRMRAATPISPFPAQGTLARIAARRARVVAPPTVAAAGPGGTVRVPVPSVGAWGRDPGSEMPPHPGIEKLGPGSEGVGGQLKRDVEKQMKGVDWSGFTGGLLSSWNKMQRKFAGRKGLLGGFSGVLLVGMTGLLSMFAAAINAVGGAIVAIVPIVAALTAGLVALGTAAGAVALGLGAVAAIGVPALQDIQKKYSAVESAIDAVNSATTAKARQKALRELAKANAKLSASEYSVIGAVKQLKEAWANATAPMKEQFLGVTTVVLQFAKEMLPTVIPVLREYMNIFQRNTTGALDFMRQPEQIALTKRALQPLPGLADQAFQAFGKFALILRGLVIASTPLAQWILKGLNEWLGKLSDTASSATGLKRWTDEFNSAKPVLSAVWKFTTALVGAFWRLGKAAKPLSVGILGGLTNWLEGIGNSPEKMKKLTKTFSDLQPALEAVGTILGALVSGFVQIGVIGGPYLKPLARIIKEEIVPAIVSFIDKFTKATADDMPKFLSGVAQLADFIAGPLAAAIGTILGWATRILARFNALSGSSKGWIVGILATITILHKTGIFKLQKVFGFLGKIIARSNLAKRAIGLATKIPGVKTIIEKVTGKGVGEALLGKRDGSPTKPFYVIVMAEPGEGPTGTVLGKGKGAAGGGGAISRFFKGPFGKNLLKVGGAAAAGVFAYDQMKGQAAGGDVISRAARGSEEYKAGMEGIEKQFLARRMTVAQKRVAEKALIASLDDTPIAKARLRQVREQALEQEPLRKMAVGKLNRFIAFATGLQEQAPSRKAKSEIVGFKTQARQYVFDIMNRLDTVTPDVRGATQNITHLFSHTFPNLLTQWLTRHNVVSQIPAFQYGGITRGLTLAGEQGREAIIPLQPPRLSGLDPLMSAIGAYSRRGSKPVRGSGLTPTSHGRAGGGTEGSRSPAGTTIVVENVTVVTNNPQDFWDQLIREIRIAEAQISYQSPVQLYSE